MALRGSLLLTAVLAGYMGAVPVHACHGTPSEGTGWSVAGGHAHAGACRTHSSTDQGPARVGCRAGCCHGDPGAPAGSPADREGPSDPRAPKPHGLCCADVPLDGSVPCSAVSLVPAAPLATALPAPSAAVESALPPDLPDPDAGPPGVRGVVLLR